MENTENHCFSSVFDENDHFSKCDCFLHRPCDYSQTVPDPLQGPAQSDQREDGRGLVRLLGRNLSNTRANPPPPTARYRPPPGTHVPVPRTQVPVPHHHPPPAGVSVWPFTLSRRVGVVHQASYFLHMSARLHRPRHRSRRGQWREEKFNFRRSRQKIGS